MEGLRGIYFGTFPNVLGVLSILLNHWENARGDNPVCLVKVVIDLW